MSWRSSFSFTRSVCDRLGRRDDTRRGPRSARWGDAGWSRGVHPRNLDDPDGEVGVELQLVRDDAPGGPVVYHVPMTYRGHPLPASEAALIGTAEHGVLGPRWVYDAGARPRRAATDRRTPERRGRPTAPEQERHA